MRVTGHHALPPAIELDRASGFAPPSSGWKPEVLLLNYARTNTSFAIYRSATLRWACRPIGSRCVLIIKDPENKKAPFSEGAFRLALCWTLLTAVQPPPIRQGLHAFDSRLQRSLLQRLSRTVARVGTNSSVPNISSVFGYLGMCVTSECGPPCLRVSCSSPVRRNYAERSKACQGEFYVFSSIANVSCLV